MRSSLFHRLKALRGNHDCNFLSEFRYEKRLLLKVYVAAALARRIEFSSTDTIRIPAANEARLTGDIAYASHIFPYVRRSLGSENKSSLHSLR